MCIFIFTAKNDHADDLNDILIDQRHENDRQQEEIAGLNEKLKQLEQIIKDKDRIISMLREQLDQARK